VFEQIVQLISDAAAPIAIPGGAALGHTNGLSNAKAIFALNVMFDNLGKPGGVLLTPNADSTHRSASAQEMADLIERMNSGEVSTLFIHGVNPLFELPKSSGFAEALGNVGTVISFATFPDETAVASDYVFPDRHGLESWGYQRVTAGTPQTVISGDQPVVSGVYKPDSSELMYDTRSTADVLLAAVQRAGGEIAPSLPFQDEIEYMQNKLADLISRPDGSFSAPEINAFMAYFQQFGGWWSNTQGEVPSADTSSENFEVQAAQFAGEGEFFFIPFVSPTLGEAGANKPWLQELADPTTTVMWNTWVEINPETAHELGIDNDDVVKIVSESGEVEAPVYLYPAIRPDTIAMPFGQGHTAYGRYAQGRGANPADLLGLHFNEAGDLAFAGMKVRLEKTGRKQPLSRLESRIGVYGEGMGEEGH
jgi:anaerobic selenocysteine-containing dehydrogenase